MHTVLPAMNFICRSFVVVCMLQSTLQQRNNAVNVSIAEMSKRPNVHGREIT